MKNNWENNWKDYYKILQVDSSAEPEVIKAAYTKLAQKYHPDVNPSSFAGQKMKDLNEAYEILSNLEKRQKYNSKYSYKSKREDQTGNASESNSKPNSYGSDEVKKTSSGYERENRRKFIPLGGVFALIVLISIGAFFIFYSIYNSGQSNGQLPSSSTLMPVIVRDSSTPSVVYKTPSRTSSGISGVSLQPGSIISTATTFTTSINPSVLSQSVVLTALVTPTGPGYYTPTGLVHFFWKYRTGNYDIATVNLDNSGKAFCTWSPTYDTGSYVLEADYKGGSNYSPSSGTVTQQVIRIDTTTAFTTNLNPSNLSQTVILTATVIPAKTGYGMPTGSVHFFWKYRTGNYDIATVNLDNSGKAICTWVPTYGAMNYSLEADYKGSTTYAASSGSINQNVSILK